MKIFDKEYSSEELCDVERDVTEALDGDFNDKMLVIPVDKNRLHTGTFRVTIEYVDETNRKE